MPDTVYKIIPINSYWLNELVAEIILYRVRRKITIKNGAIITKCPELVDFTMEIFGETLFLVEETHEQNRPNVQTDRPRHKRRAPSKTMQANKSQSGSHPALRLVTA